MPFFQKNTFDHFDQIEFSEWLDAISAFEFNMQTAAFCGAPRLDIDAQDLQMAKANLHYFDFVGFVKEFEDAIELFKQVYGIHSDNPIPVLNVHSEQIELSQELQNQLLERCQYDIELVDYAKRLFKAKKAAWDLLIANDPDLLPPSIT